MVTASGDNGPTALPVGGTADPVKACGYAPSFPATSPYVLSVGATQVRTETRPGAHRASSSPYLVLAEPCYWTHSEPCYWTP